MAFPLKQRRALPKQGAKDSLTPAQVAAIKEKSSKVLGNKTGATGFIMKKKLA